MRSVQDWYKENSRGLNLPDLQSLSEIYNSVYNRGQFNGSFTDFVRGNVANPTGSSWYADTAPPNPVGPAGPTFPQLQNPTPAPPPQFSPTGFPLPNPQMPPGQSG
jgi:hypothetical protein